MGGALCRICMGINYEEVDVELGRMAMVMLLGCDRFHPAPSVSCAERRLVEPFVNSN